MQPEATIIQTYFAKLGLDKEIADIYSALHAHGPQTISELSRTARVERTRIYRLIDKLLDSNLIEVESHHKRGVIKAAPITNLRIMINQKEQELKSLQDDLSLIEQTLARNSLSDPATRVQFYRGAAGIRQMLWNELGSKTTTIGYHFQILDTSTGNHFMHRWAAEVEQRKLCRKIMFGDEYVRSWKARRPPGHRIAGIEYHYISPNIFPVTHACDVYGDVTAYYNWKNGEIFGIEIYNKQIADAQRQSLEMLWTKSKPETRF